mgnify:CR=1 FL=1
METYVIAALSSTLLIALSVIGYLYNKAQQRNEEDLTYIGQQYEQLNNNMLTGFRDIREVLSDFNSRLALEENKQEMFQERCDRIAMANDKTLERFDRRIEIIEKTLSTHDLEIGLLKKSSNYGRKTKSPNP